MVVVVGVVVAGLVIGRRRLVVGHRRLVETVVVGLAVGGIVLGGLLVMGDSLSATMVRGTCGHTLKDRCMQVYGFSK